ncbi:MAG: tetratricopeptide repeat protein [Luteitalea sp.]|nr:tetratricopeptide repeat protein [Luteitalea sp.]
MPLPYLRVIALLVAVGSQAVGARQPLPVPELSLEAYPPEARRAIEPAYREAVANPEDAGAVGRLAMTLHAWEQWDRAAAAYARAAALAPKTFDWPYLAAVVAARTKRSAEAVPWLETALTLRPDYLPARLKLAEALLETAQREKSARHFEALAREPEAAAPAEYGLGRVAAEDGRTEAAVAHYRRACSLFPEFGAAHYALAMAYRDLDRRDEARGELELHHKYGTRWPGLDDPLLAGVHALKVDSRSQAQRGLELAKAGRLEEAVQAHEAALAANPELVQAHANLISLYGRLKEWQKAEAHYRAIVDAGRESDEAHYNYGVLLGLQKRYAEAAEAYRKAIEVNPQRASAHNNLGQLLEQDGRVDEALDAYQRAVREAPTFRLARFNLGRMFIGSRRFDEAIAALSKLTTPVDAETPQYLFALATAYVHAGQREVGLEWATKAKQLAESHGQTALAAAIERELAGLR